MSAFYTAKEISFFIGTPLHAIDLRNYVETKRLSERGIEAVSESCDLAVMQHPSSQSYIARVAVSRLEEDVKIFADDENATKLPVFKAISAPSALTDSQSLAAVTARSTQLIEMLEQLRARDIAMVRAGIDEVLEVCNGGLARGRGEEIAIAHGLLQEACAEASLVSLFEINPPPLSYRD